MIIRVLAENTAVSEAFGSEHGLSLHIETKGRGILFDTGASALFARNAEKMGVDLTKAELAVISHGHYDHWGGLAEFLSINAGASVYVHEKAFGSHYAKRPDGKLFDIGWT
jgi:7,8-dihydropterin-6-yl-methyl-4-(beta-D-ribofuranosyl)aminobenzene 5'-phosphate synthase